jgi:ferritin-like metal-binding protein YciE
MAKVSNPRDLLVQLLGELLHVERRLAGEVLRALSDAVRDDELRDVLRRHLEETREHVERIEVAFRRLEVAPSANLSRAFESAVAQHDELAPTIVEAHLADVFHAQAALHTEHWEIAAYTTVLELAVHSDADLGPLEDSLADEVRAREELRLAIARLARAI